MNYQEQVKILFEEQKENWDLMKDNLDGLKHARIKKFSFEGYSINIQFNPKRITSSAARVDKESINKRKCFLCSAHRPAAQQQVLFENDYEILCNPFPIFNRHYTIAKLLHSPQLIEGNFSSLLDLSRALPDLVIFYNGPKCGASAPDHLHFQAGNLGFLPIEEEYAGLKADFGRTILDSPGMSVLAVDDGLRRFIMIESDENERINVLFQDILDGTSAGPEEDEPMMNILSWYQDKWRVMIFLRQEHRPWQFFAEGEDNILISPAGVDFGGTMIMPLEKDFDKITGEDIRDIFRQISYLPEKFRDLEDYLITRIKNYS